MDVGVRVNLPELILSPSFKITNKPTYRRYSWVLTNKTAAFDGYLRNALVINDQFPGPLIEANEGDTLEINVSNQLEQDVSIHWHGIFQKGTPWMDGVAGVTQCSIPVGTSFKYRFTIQEQFGTFWYHAHTANLMADGLVGPLIVHSPRDLLKRGVHFDNDVVFVLMDWYHNMSSVIANQQTSPVGYNNSVAAPSANSGLINGVGFYDCSFAEPSARCQTPQKFLQLNVGSGDRTRIRIIQAGSHAMYRVSTDERTMDVIEADSVGVKGPPGIHRLPIHNGQRYSVVVNTQSDKPGSRFLMRATIDTDCYVEFFLVAPGIDGLARSVRVVINVNERRGASFSPTTDLPSTKDWNDPTGGVCADLDPSSLVPLLRQDAPAKVLGRVFYENSFGSILIPGATGVSGRFFVGGTSWRTFVYQPLLPKMLAGGTNRLNPLDVTALTLPEDGWYDIVINNMDLAIDHIYHLHGVDSMIVASGPGRLTPGQAEMTAFNTTNPLRRDSFIVSGGSFLVLRVQSNNPGVWILHCHIGWHLAGGFAGVIVIQPDKLSKMVLPQENRELCRAKNYINRDQTELGRRQTLDGGMKPKALEKRKNQRSAYVNHPLDAFKIGIETDPLLFDRLVLKTYI
ncbi:multi-copper oxidase laccase-like protein [Phakopsora pachyrhizi]|uniref:Multi-copper oxidase laccase-like protein n=1 Tax=Phakopsora pachyrhizi TaxID=170000 RepID=A0AAV0BSK6_PHAPC|nr:multi-copper oxidase laccase-like protein [Phakopsora pachyrhizi]CAH7689407.1 multi-copper oxidase laccase-like protein [Phakopsora pachyrhizi]